MVQEPGHKVQEMKNKLVPKELSQEILLVKNTSVKTSMTQKLVTSK
ncbi:MAG: hypothetical protein H6767_02975 [Candidatus Peribacteria bacterium]|nr:MAG: hypothetical protein H6767_02975 [Candidatus Peribacteria bacterium]